MDAAYEYLLQNLSSQLRQVNEAYTDSCILNERYCLIENKLRFAYELLLFVSRRLNKKLLSRTCRMFLLNCIIKTTLVD